MGLFVIENTDELSVGDGFVGRKPSDTVAAAKSKFSLSLPSSSDSPED